jgi:putative peptidoglycan lipid II flippase
MTGIKEQNKDLNAQTSINRQLSQKNIIFSAFGMGAGTLISRILGLVRDAALAALFPTIVRDAFAIGFRLPNFFRRVLGEGALSVSFVPTYVELLNTDPLKAEKLKNIVFSFLFLLSSVISVLGILYIRPLLGFIIDEATFSPGGESFALTVRIAKWMFAYLFLITQFAFCMSVLNAHKKFWVAGVAPAFFNLGFILLLFIPNAYVSFDGQQLAFGVLFGGLLQLFVVGGSYLSNFSVPRPNLDFFFKPFRRVFLATTPSLFAIGVLQIISLINIHLCSQVGPGANSYIYFADRILELPQSLIAVSLGTAMLPSLSEMWIKSRADFDETLIKSIRVFLFFALPAAVGMVFLSLPVTQLLFQRGAFDLEQSLQVASVVKIYGGLLVVSGLGRIFLPVYYSFKNTWYPAAVAVVVLINHFIVGQILVDLYGLPGVAMATLSSSVVNICLLFIGMGLFTKRTYVKESIGAVLRFFPAVLILAAFLWTVDGYISQSSVILRVSGSVAAILGAVVVYFGSAFLFKIDEVKLLGSLISKLKR